MLRSTIDGFVARVLRVRGALAQERGAVSAEYGLLLVLIALAIIAAATAFGIAVTGLFESGSAGVGGV